MFSLSASEFMDMKNIRFNVKRSFSSLPTFDMPLSYRYFFIYFKRNKIFE